MSTDAMIRSAAGGHGWQSEPIDDYLRRRWLWSLSRATSNHELPENIGDLLSYINGCLSALTGSNRPWVPGLGRLLADTSADESNIIQIALQCAANNGLGSWTCNVDPGSVFYFDSFPLLLHGRVCFNAIQDRVSLTWERGEQIRTRVSFEKQCGLWVRDDGNRALPGIGDIGVSCNVLDDADSEVSKLGDGVCSFSSIEDRRTTLREALNCIRTHSPEIFAWISRVLAGISFLAPAGERMSGSGSARSLPGLIWASHPIPAEQLAVLIIHECSHQYFFAMTDAVNVVIPGSVEQHFSPFKKVARPLISVLLALHAAVNMSRYIALLQSEGRASPYLLREALTLAQDVETMSRSIGESKELTEDGQLFMRYLRLGS